MKPINDKPATLYRREVDSALETMSVDELRLFAALAGKYTRAREKYGPLVLRTDTRNFRLEARAERMDQLFYDTCVELSDDLRREDAGE